MNKELEKIILRVIINFGAGILQCNVTIKDKENNMTNGYLWASAYFSMIYFITRVNGIQDSISIDQVWKIKDPETDEWILVDAYLRKYF